jgi:nucleoside-diphosphate-sugar epimerase
MQALILGCGFVGTAFGAALVARGVSVTGTCRQESGSAALLAQGITPLIFDGTPTLALTHCAGTANIILNSIPPSPAGDLAFGALGEVLSVSHARWIGYLSTTGVYGDRAGGWAFEDDVPSPLSVEAHRRAVAEEQWRSLPDGTHIFRLPGIYGSGRCALDQVKAGTARRIYKPGQVFSRAHRDDIVSALLASVDRPNPGRAYNICDDLPCASGEVIVYACQLLGVALPPLLPFEAAGLSDMGRRFYSECKRVSNARAKAELGWRPAFPTYVEGLVDCLNGDAVSAPIGSDEA